MEDEMITYAHKENPTGQRYRQYAKDKVPAWAVDIQPEVKDETQTNDDDHDHVGLYLWVRTAHSE